MARSFSRGVLGWDTDDIFNALTDILGFDEVRNIDNKMTAKCKQCHDVIDGPNTPKLCRSCFYLNFIGIEDGRKGGRYVPHDSKLYERKYGESYHQR